MSPNDRYSHNDASDIEMNILGHFLTSDIGYDYHSSFKEWAVNDNWNDETNGNLTGLEKKGNYILLTDLFSEEKVPTVLKMTREQYIQAITDWEKRSAS